MTVRCRHCHRPLTDPVSLREGVGPVCRELAAGLEPLFPESPIDGELRATFSTTLEQLAQGLVDVDDAPELVPRLAAEILALREATTQRIPT